MKSLYILLPVFLFGLQVHAQTAVNLEIQHLINGEILNMGSPYTAEEGYNFNITRLEYYLTDIKIIHDGGIITEVEDTWLLIDAMDNTSFNLGSFDLNVIEGLQFSVGVAPDENHLDPATYPADHPLAPQNPSMHWGWASGYRFVALEGKAGPNLLITYEIHALGDENYFNVLMVGDAVSDGNSQTIFVQADCNEMFNNINVSGGLISHGSSGEAQTLLQNFKVIVFSIVDQVVSQEELHANFQVNLYPNPVNSDVLNISIPELTNTKCTLILMDEQGRKLVDYTITGNKNKLDMSTFENGIYFLRISSANQSRIEKIIVQR